MQGRLYVLHIPIPRAVDQDLDHLGGRRHGLVHMHLVCSAARLHGSEQRKGSTVLHMITHA